MALFCVAMRRDSVFRLKFHFLVWDFAFFVSWNMLVEQTGRKQLRDSMSLWELAFCQTAQDGEAEEILS